MPTAAAALVADGITRTYEFLTVIPAPELNALTCIRSCEYCMVYTVLAVTVSWAEAGSAFGMTWTFVYRAGPLQVRQ